MELTICVENVAQLLSELARIPKGGAIPDLRDTIVVRVLHSTILEKPLIVIAGYRERTDDFARLRQQQSPPSGRRRVAPMDVGLPRDPFL